MTIINVLSIDAWRDGSGWQWNQWYKAGQCDVAVCDYPPRKLLAFMREQGYLSPTSVGRVAIEDDQYNVVIVDKGTREPLFALEYGAAQS